MQKNKYLVFALEDERYGAPLEYIQEIVGIMDATRVPKMPAFIKGVVNLRGKIIPVMDLRRKFDMEEREYDKRTCIVITEVMLFESKTTMGIIVDEVLEVITVNEEDIYTVPKYGVEEDEKVISGMIRAKDKVIVLLQIDKVLNTQEIISLEEMKENV